MTFDLGRVFGESFRILRKKGPLFVAITALVLLPVLLVMFLLRGYYEATQDPATIAPDAELQEVLDVLLDLYRNMGIFQGTITLAENLLMPIATAFIVLATFRTLRGRPSTASETLENGVRHLVPLIGMGLLYTLSASFGCALCCFPGIFISIAWFVAGPAIVVESLGPIDGLRRSWALVLPQFWWCLLTGFLSYLIAVIPGIIVAVLSINLPVEATLVATWLGRVITVSLMAIVSCVLYDELRRISNETGVDEYEAIFE